MGGRRGERRTAAGVWGKKFFFRLSQARAKCLPGSIFGWIRARGCGAGARAVPGARGVHGARGSSQCDVCIVPTPCEARCPEISAPRAPRA